MRIITISGASVAGAAALALSAVVGTSVVQSAAAADVQRFGGSDRIATAIEVFQQNRATFTSDTVVLAGSGGFADALTATPLAAQLKAPVLTTGATALDTRVLQSMKAQGVKNVVVVGGTGAVSASAQQAATTAGMTVERLGGKDRFETARLIAARVLKQNGGTKLPVFVADGTGYADALASGSAAVKQGGVVLLSRTGATDPITEAMIKDESSSVVAVGGGAARAMDAAGITATKVVGATRYETAASLARAYFAAPKSVVLASGADYGDAVAGSPLAALTGAPILLTPPTELPVPVAQYLAEKKPNIAVLGGPASIPAALATKAEAVADTGDVGATTPSPTATPTSTSTTGTGTTSPSPTGTSTTTPPPTSTSSTSTTTTAPPPTETTTTTTPPPTETTTTTPPPTETTPPPAA